METRGEGGGPGRRTIEFQRQREKNRIVVVGVQKTKQLKQFAGQTFFSQNRSRKNKKKQYHKQGAHQAQSDWGRGGGTWALESSAQSCLVIRAQFFFQGRKNCIVLIREKRVYLPSICQVVFPQLLYRPLLTVREFDYQGCRGIQFVIAKFKKRTKQMAFIQFLCVCL